MPDIVTKPSYLHDPNSGTRRLRVLIVLAIASWAAVVGAQGPSDGASAPAVTVGSSPSDDEYRVGADDVLQIQVSGREELTRLVTVDPAGKIQAPLIGAIDVAGKTPATLTEELTERYQLLDPSVTEALVSVAKYNSRTLTFIGAIANPGTTHVGRPASTFRVSQSVTAAMPPSIARRRSSA